MMMSAPVKPMRPMEIEFESDDEMKRFINWAASKEKDNSAEMKRIREEFKNIRGMRRKGF